MDNYIRFDWAIKRLLRNKTDFDVVNGFLSCLLGKQIYITKVLESEGNKRTIEDKIKEEKIVLNSHNARLSIDTIATITGLTTEQVIEILKRYKK